ncbi:glycosyltransferase, partial [Providencia heimbachae]|uniref:glycosyltransferase n=1 Tax=Providencia heimbachae TaxID=333962 RepID=UPI002240976F
SNIKSPDKNNFIFLFVGRIIKDKGIVELIQAFNKIDKSKYPCKLIIAGDVDNGNKSTISSDDVLQWTSSDNITWLGNVNNMPELYNYCDCIILPSYREGLSKTLIEAGAMKLPAITTNVPGCQDIISDGINGFLCKVKNSEDLYTK